MAQYCTHLMHWQSIASQLSKAQPPPVINHRFYLYFLDGQRKFVNNKLTTITTVHLFLPARRYVSVILTMDRCLYVCPSVCHKPLIDMAERIQLRSAV